MKKNKDDQFEDLKSFINSRLTRHSDSLFDDMKQFIDSRFSQYESRFDDKLDKKLGGLEIKIDKKIEYLRDEMHDGFIGVGEAFELVHDHLDKFEERITKLETAA